MKYLVCATLLLTLAPAVASAGDSYDACLKEQKALKSREADDCSGLKYLLNPSGCFAARKKVKEFAAGTCGEIIRAGKVEVSAAPAAPAVPEKKIIVPPAAVPAAKPVVTPEKPAAAATKTAPAPQASSPLTMEQLKEENARLRAEIGRLKADMERMKKVGY